MDLMASFVEGAHESDTVRIVDEARPTRGDPPTRGSAGRIDAEFTAFYRAEHDGQVRRAALLVGSEEAANDIVHDALVAMLRRWGAISHPGSYLNRAVLNGCRGLGRRKHVDQSARRRLRADLADHPDEVLFDVIGRLPFNQRAAAVMRFYDRMTEQEIAAALDCKTGSIGPWIHRALASMRWELS